MLSTEQAWAIVNAIQDGQKQAAVAELIGCTTRTVRKVWKFYKRNQTIEGRVHRRPPATLIESLRKEHAWLFLDEYVSTLAAVGNRCVRSPVDSYQV